MSRGPERRPLRCPTTLSAGMVACALGAVPLFGGHAGAQTPASEPPAAESGGVRPEASGRVVRVFDFDEALINPDPVPMNWVRGQNNPPDRLRPAFPPWNAAELDRTHSAGAAGPAAASVVLPTSGGSTSLLLAPGVLAVFPGADYRVAARIRTEGCAHARAVLAARLLDGRGRPIEAAPTVYGAPVGATGEGWVSVGVEVVGLSDQAAYLQIELLLVQPEELARLRGEAGAEPARAGSAGPVGGPIWPEDHQARAWFDDVTVVQLPRIQIQTAGASNVVFASRAPELTMVVRDLTGEALTLRAQVRDVSGRVVDELERVLPPGRNESVWTPRLPGLGWYRVTMGVNSPLGVIGSAWSDVVWTLDPSAISGAGEPIAGGDSSRGSLDRVRLGLSSDDGSDAVMSALPELADRVGAGAVVLPVWREGMSVAQMPARVKELLGAIDHMVGAGRRVTLGLSMWPREVARTLRVERDDVLGALVSELDRVAAGPKGAPDGTDIVWRPWVDPVLDRFGQRVERWQLGAVGASGGERSAFAGDLPSQIAKAEGYFRRLVPGPVLTVPWRADVETNAARLGVSRAGERGAVVSASADTPGPVLREMVRAWRGAVAADTRPSAARPELTIALAREQSGLSPADATAELVKRAAMIWEGLGADAGADRGVVTMSLHEPWTISQGRRPRVMPGPELGAWRNLLERFADRRVIGRLPLSAIAGPTPSAADGQPAEALILAPLPGRESRGGALIAWNDSGEPAFIDGVLSADPVRVVDVFGNERPAPPGAEPGSVRIPVGRKPVFVEGIDVELVRFRTMLRLDPDRMDAVNREHEHELVIGNPWPTTISGRLTIVEPGGFDGRGGVRDRNWRITPRVLEFSVAPGQTSRLPVKVAFGPGEETGRKKFVFLASVTAARSYPPVYFTQQVELGLPSLRLALTQVASSGGDVIVEAKLTNVGERVLSVDLTGFAPDQPRQRIGVSGLGPGETATRALHFKGVLAALRGQRVAVSAEVAEQDTGSSAGRLNTSIAIE